MGSYLPLFRISVEHEFFSNARCSCLEFVPTEMTSCVIDNAGLLLHKAPGEISVAYDQDRLEALQLYAQDPGDPLDFVFKVYSTDPDFKSYSEPFGETDAAMLYFDNRQPVVTEANRIRLHGGQYASKTNLTNLDSFQVKDVISKKDRLIPPVLVVKICAHGKEGSLFSDRFEATAKDCTIAFNTRRTLWKYYLLGSMARKNAYILDPDNRVEFEFAGETALSDARPALAFTSKQSIPLRERQDYRFQLRETGPGGEKILIKRLPVAAVRQAGKEEVVSGNELVVSEIYING